MNDEFILATMQALAVSAGLRIMELFRSDIASASKSDGSPVTEADFAAEALILAGLDSALPRCVCVAEERSAAGMGIADPGPEFFLVDALDGTREFLAGRPEFTVNIALIRDRDPVLGVVYAPARRELYCGSRHGAFLTTFDEDMAPSPATAIRVRPRALPATIVVSRFHRSAATDAYLREHPGADVVSVGSSLKFCLVSIGQADIYPCLGRTMEWDTAAGHAVLVAAGGTVLTSEQAPLLYGKIGQLDADFANPWFVASSATLVD